jgi:WD40 repeat protein
LAAGFNYRIYIYNIETGGLISTLQQHSAYYIYDIVLISDQLLASSSSDKTIGIWDLTSNTLKMILYGHTDEASGLKLVSPEILASGSSDKTIRLWNTITGQLIRTLSNHTNSIWWSVNLLLSDNQTLVTGSLDKTIKLWDWKTGQCLKTINSGIEIWSSAVVSSKHFKYFYIL